MALTARRVETAKEGRYYDENGLFLLVRKTGAKSWVFRYQLLGKRYDLGLGAYPAVGLAMARDRVLELRRQLAEGINPKHSREKEKQRTLFRFQDVASALIETEDILEALKPIWEEKPETASRVRQRIEAVLDYASVMKLRQGDNPARWKGHLDHLLAKPNKIKAVEHHPALDYRELPSFMQDLTKREGVSARALIFTILTGVRSGNVRAMTWDEIDWQAKIWIIPASKMKASKEHRVPLTDQALACVGEPQAGKGLVFGSDTKKGKPLSNMSLSAVLKRMGRDDITVHGFRSTFRDWAGETTSFPREVIEHAMAHQLKDKAEASYARGDLLAKRWEVMKAWSVYAFGE
jgi:integrase